MTREYPDSFATLIEKVVKMVLTSLLNEGAQATDWLTLFKAKATDLQRVARHELRNHASDRGQSVRQLSAHMGVGPRKVRKWIKAGLLEAINVGSASRSQLRIMPEAVDALLQRLAVSKARAPRRRRERVDPEIERLLM